MALLLQLNWADVLLQHVLPELDLPSCFALRTVSADCRALVDQYFASMKELKIVNRKTSPISSFELLRCGRLKSLNFAGCKFLTDEMLLPILSNNRNIVRLNLSYCDKLTAKAIQPAIVDCKLRELRLARCVWLTPGAIEALALHQDQLQVVDFSRCINLTSSSLIIFIKKFNKIETMALTGVTQVDDFCMMAISNYSTALKNLNVSDCNKITPNGTWAVRLKCNNLKTLSMRLDINPKDSDFFPIPRGVIQVQPGHVPRFAWRRTHK